MDHQLFQDLLSDYAEGTLSPAQRQEFENHRETCADCAKLSTSFVFALRELHAFPQLEVPSDFTAKVLARTIHQPQALGLWQGFWFWLRFPRLTPVAMLSLLALPLLMVAGTREGREVAKEVNMVTHQTYSRALRLVRKGEDLKETARAVRGQLPERLEETLGWLEDRFGFGPEAEPEPAPAQGDPEPSVTPDPAEEGQRSSHTQADLFRT